MTKEQKVINFYILTNKLKNVIRKGWLTWHVSSERVESVAEHIYGTQMLALAMYSEYGYDLNLEKIMYMLAIHELEETIIGDLTFREISSTEKEKIGHEAVEKIVAELLTGEEVKNLIYEFDSKSTDEAKFAYYCDKLECDLQAKIYDENNYVLLENQLASDNHNPEVIEKIQQGKTTWSGSWMMHDRPLFENDANFTSVLDYAMKNKIYKRETRK